MSLRIVLFLGFFVAAATFSTVFGQVVFDPKPVAVACSASNETTPVPLPNKFYFVPCSAPSGLKTATSGNVANAVATATLAPVADLTTYVTGFDITAGGATSGACVIATLSGVKGASPAYIFCTPAGVTIQATPLIIRFDPPLRALTIESSPSIQLPALGAGNVHAMANIHGFSQ